MSETMPFSIGAEVVCTDGECGRLTRVVIDPVARAVTDLVVEPKHRIALGRLVPIDLVELSGEEIRLKCSQAAFEQLEAAEEMQYLPGVNAGLDYGSDHAWGLPYYGLVAVGTDPGSANAVQPIVRDRVPLGEVDVRRGEAVHATDGTIGKVQGIVINPSDHQVTHVLLQEGHLWGKKEVAIPISAVTDVRNGIQLSLSKDEVKDLPAVDIETRQ